MTVPKISTGSCVGCKKSTRLLNGACGSCRQKFGKNCGHIMAKVRSEPYFAKLCYNQLKPEDKPNFLEMFGDCLPECTPPEKS